MQPGAPRKRTGETERILPIARPAIMLAIVILIANQGQANPACGKSNSHRDTNCLSASWRNPQGAEDSSERSRFSVQTLCAQSGTVVAKVDTRSDMVCTLHRTVSRRRYGESRPGIRWIYCCETLSDSGSR